MAEWKEAEENVTAKLAILDGLIKKHEDLDKKVTGQENLTQKFKQEIGDARKLFEDSVSKIGDVDSEKLKKVIDKFDEIEKNIEIEAGKATNGVGAEAKPSGQKSDLTLTEEQIKKADEVFLKLSPEERVIIKSDPDKRTKFLEAAIMAIPEVPESLFDKAPEDEGQVKNNFLELFGLTNKDASVVGGTKPMSSSGFANADPLGGKTILNKNSRRLIDGKIPRPSTS